MLLRMKVANNFLFNNFFLPVCKTMIIRHLVFFSIVSNGLINLDLSQNICVQSGSIPLLSESYTCFKLINNLKASLFEKIDFRVSCQFANKLSETKLDIRDHALIVTTALTIFFKIE